VKANEVNPPGERQPRRSRGRRWLRRLAIAAALGILLLVLAYAEREHWLSPLARELARRAGESLGAEITLARVSGESTSALVLEGVSWRSASSPLRRVDEARVTVHYDLGELLHGRFRGRVRVEGRGIELELGPSGATSAASTPLELPELEGFELELADLRLRVNGNELPPLDSLSAAGSLARQDVRLERLALASGANRATLAAASLNLSDPSATALARAFRGTLHLSVADARALAQLYPATWPLRAAELELTAEGERARLTGRVELEGGKLVLERGELVWPATAEPGEIQVDLGLQADFEDLTPLGALLGRNLGGRWRGALDVRGPLRAPRGRFVGRGEGVRVAELALDSVEVDVSTDGQRARVEHCEASGPDLELALRGELGLEPLELRDVALNCAAGSQALAPFLPYPCEHAFVHARLSGPLEDLQGALEASVSGLELGGMRIDDAAAHGELARGTLHVSELRLTSGESFVEGAGTLARAGDGFTAELERLALAWQGAQVALERGAHLAFGPGRFDVADVALRSQGPSGEGRATFAVHHADGTTRGVLECHAYDAGPLLAPFLPAGTGAGRIDGTLEGTLGGAEPRLAFSLALEGWSAGAAWPSLAGRLEGEYDGGTLALRRFALADGATTDAEATRVEGSLRMPFDFARPLSPAEGPLQLELELDSAEPARTLARLGLESGVASGRAHLTAKLGGEWKALTGTLRLTAADVALGRADGAPLCQLAADVTLGEGLRIERARLTSPNGHLELAGTLDVPLDPTRWRDERFLLLDSALDLKADVAIDDLAWLAGLSGELRRISGRVAGALELRGSALEPSLSGTLSWTGGELRLVSLGSPLRNVSAALHFQDDVVSVDALTAEFAGAPVSVTGTLEPFGPFPRLDLALKGKNLLLARNARLRLRADAELVVKGTPSQLAIRGELGIAEGRYSGEISPLEELLRATKGGKSVDKGEATHFSLWSEGPLASANFDVHLGGARRFEFQTNLLAVGLRPDAWLRGTGEFPVLEGPVYIEHATATLPSGTMELSSGLLSFRREAPLNPDVALRAEMRVQGHDVRATATGPLDGPPEVELSSSPPLAQDDLWLLVLTGQLPTTNKGDRSAQAMEALAVFLARDSLLRWFSSGPIDAEGLLERFEIDVGAETSVSGKLTGRVLFYLKPKDVRSGRATYLSGELDEYDRVNYALGIVFRPR